MARGQTYEEAQGNAGVIVSALHLACEPQCDGAHVTPSPPRRSSFAGIGCSPGAAAHPCGSSQTAHAKVDVCCGRLHRTPQPRPACTGAWLARTAASLTRVASFAS
eukprot:6175349-Pleurochrysis_carterae.AAC.1